METVIIMYKLESNGPWNRATFKIKKADLAKYQLLKKKEAKAKARELVENSVLGKDIYDVDYKW